ncbi:dihydroorotate dehydrogenase electron transfer subunit [Candidatus Fermentibacteria bacterium]|nr:dihydroorotate dehydrogenase electron transfer subunit [Candidatus Fermentibacteria bacterium]
MPASLFEPGLMRTCRIQSVIVHSPSLKSFYLPSSLDAAPGQFVNLWLPGVDEKPISISGMRDGLMELSVKSVGPFTRALMDCAPGDLVGIRGPFGTGFSPASNSLLIGGGTGIAPIRFLAQSLRDRGMPYALVCGARSRCELIFEDELREWGCRFASDDGTCGICGVVTDLLDEAGESGLISVVCAAGPEPMLLRIMAWADGRSLPYQISFERYMKCGIGICGSCCLDGSGIRVCVEGPVLGKDQIAQVTECGLPHRDASGLRLGE